MEQLNDLLSKAKERLAEIAKNIENHVAQFQMMMGQKMEAELLVNHLGELLKAEGDKLVQQLAEEVKDEIIPEAQE